MYEHDYDGSLAKVGKRHLGKTRWTREEVYTHTDTCLNNSKFCLIRNISHFTQERSPPRNLETVFVIVRTNHIH